VINTAPLARGKDRIMAFVKATKRKAKLRLAVYGPSGSGKTFTSLRIATGMGGQIAVIDTERGSASKYADRFDFAVMELEDRTVEGYARAIREAGQGGFNVLIIDSLSHGWHELLDEVDKIAKSKYRGNTWSAWSEGTPKQRMMVDEILNSPMHIIATMRSKTEWTQERDKNDRVKPVKVGLAPEQGKGIEYEFDMLMEMSTEHIALVAKDRTGKFQDKPIEKPGEDFGKELVAWLEDGEAAKPKPAPIDNPPAIKIDPDDPMTDPDKFVALISDAFEGRDFHPDDRARIVANVCKSKRINSILHLDLDQRRKMLAAIVDGKFDASKKREVAPA
jgi:hypothetical protein